MKEITRILFRRAKVYRLSVHNLIDFFFQYDDMIMAKRSNAELINGLIGMDLGKLSAVGKRSNAELINGLLGMNLNKVTQTKNYSCQALRF